MNPFTKQYTLGKVPTFIITANTNNCTLTTLLDMHWEIIKDFKVVNTDDIELVSGDGYYGLQFSLDVMPPPEYERVER